MTHTLLDTRTPWALRELGALAGAGKNHRRAVKRLPVLDRDVLPSGSLRGVILQPAYEWLLAAPSEQ